MYPAYDPYLLKLKDHILYSDCPLYEGIHYVLHVILFSLPGYLSRLLGSLESSQVVTFCVARGEGYHLAVIVTHCLRLWYQMLWAAVSLQISR